jgi:hypothetical protein
MMKKYQEKKATHETKIVIVKKLNSLNNDIDFLFN